jgi:adenosylmethionine-8-amino-7-oxononanoate aminotransferase
LGVLALGGSPIFPKADYEPLLAGCFHGPQPNPYRCEYGGRTPEECAERCVNAIEEIIKFQGPDTVAAVVAEPVSSPLGAVVPGPNYWPRLREVCDRYGCLLIADEVITGFGRTGKMFACEHWDVTPDIMTVAKGITSGYIPMGGAIVRKSVADSFVGGPQAAFRHVITFGGHPVAAAASLKNIEIIETEGLVENSARMGRRLLDGLKELTQKHSIIGDVRGLGLMCGVEFVRDRQTREYFPEATGLGPRLTQGFTDQGVFLRGGNVMNIMPPLCVTPEEIDQIISVLDQVIGETSRQLGAP